MKVGCLAVIGLVLGAIAGGAIGIGVGFIWIQAFHTSSFEGYSGMLVFYTFMPLGIIAGGLIGAIGLGIIASRDNGTARN